MWPKPHGYHWKKECIRLDESKNFVNLERKSLSLLNQWRLLMMMSQAKNVGVLTSQQEGIMVGFLGLLNEHALPVFSVCVCVFPQISATVKNMYD